MRRTKRFVGRIFRFFIGYLQSFKFTHISNRRSSDSFYVANLLVVKKPIYAKIAKICVESFYYYNPKCKIVVYVDSFTEIEITRKLKRLIRLGVAEIKIIKSHAETWQELKLELILSMNSENEFFMDADLRWNGPIPSLSSVTYFVKEFEFANIEPYAKIIQLPEWKFGKTISMKNTSFVSWGSYRTTTEDKLMIANVMDCITKICSGKNQFLDHQNSLIRISEQIALSVLADNIPGKVNYLKSQDGFRDGAFVESSYFGATGSAF